MRRDANRRTSLALALTALAIAMPCAAWFIVGWREASQRAREIEQTPYLLARDTALRVADRLRDRLETLRENEAKRPFYHYQNFYHDPRGAYEGVAVVPSPLADGPMDPIIRTYFQLDAWGRFTLPQLNPFAPADGQPAEARETEETIRRQLELQVPTYVAILQARAGQSATRQLQTLDSQAWAQNVQASDVYFNLRNPGKATPRGQDELQKIRGGTGSVELSVGPLQWHTIPINRTPSLLALRDVQTPHGRVVQGFLVSQDAIADLMRAAPYPVSFTPGQATAEMEAPVRLGAEPWRVSVRPGLDLAEAVTKAHAVRAGFLRVFTGGVLAASIVGLCVVGLVRQTERLARQRSQFAASAAHELRTPLAGLRIYSDMLAEGLGEPAKAKDYARRVADEADRLGRVVANVLGFTRLERGTLKVHTASDNLAATVRESIARQQAALEALGTRLDVSLPESLPEVRFDRDAVAQILQNLLDNAEKHTRTAENRTIHVALAARADAIELSVTDHGPGIPRKAQRRLFQPFERGNSAESPAGLGLGLVLVEALVRAQGGTVAYHDNNGGGSRFIVTFPC